MSDVNSLALAHPPSRPSALGYHAVTAVGAAVAAITTALALAASLPAWAMFLGWVAFASGGDARAGAAKIAAFLLGLPLGLGLDLASAAIAPAAPTLATPLAVFGTVLVVLTLRKLPIVDDPLAYFLGIITVTVAAQSSAPSVPVLAIAALLGAAGAWSAGRLQSRIPSF
ncbi:MAG TPA: DUF1097 family protein [Geminicoccaceae bacterium]|jgi:hypothetical protein